LSLTDAEILELEHLLELDQIDKSKNSLLEFTKYTMFNFLESHFHKTYYNLLNKFAHGQLKRLIVTVPPQHGKSEGSSRRLPAFTFGLDPNKRIALASYNATFASKFNRQIQRIIDSEEYLKVFPDTTLNKKNIVTIAGSYLRNSEEFEIVNNDGFFKSIGVGGGLTGNSVDVMIMDDLYKDYAEATSPVISERVWEWYLTVVKTRLHNESQELIVFTRWDSLDLVGRLEEQGKVYTLQPNDDVDDLIKTLPRDVFIKINFEAIKTGEPSKLDPRKSGQALYPEKHDLEKLKSIQVLDPSKFDALYQGDPRDKEGLLYSPFDTYDTLPSLKIIKAYTDTADEGKDYLCCIVYGVPVDPLDKKLYVLDILYTQKNMEYTESKTIEIHVKNQVRQSRIESNNGGKGFARVIKSKISNFCNITWFHQSKNKIARIFSNSASVNNLIVFPKDWSSKFPEFYKHITNFKKDIAKNKHDDSADTLTGVYESEYQTQKTVKYTRR
jgi:predicted phage terminase large subunit-like protein